MIIFMGVAGAGKSVQGNLLAQHLGYEWLSTGEYLRNNINPSRRQEMLEGKLLDDGEIIDIMEDFFAGIQDKTRCVLDGFPRTLTQAKWLFDKHKNGSVEIGTVIFLKASKEVVRERLLSRGRPDDTAEALDKRFEEYEKLTLPIIDWFKHRGVAVYEINAERTVEEIQKDIISKVTTEE